MLTRLNAIIDDYLYVRTEGKWKNYLVSIQVGLTQAKNAVVNSVYQFAAYIGLSKETPVDHSVATIIEAKKKICGEFKTLNSDQPGKFDLAKTPEQWLTVAEKLGEVARDQAELRKDESLLCKALQAARGTIINEMKSIKDSPEEKAYLKRVDELFQLKVKKDNLILEAKLHGHLVDENDVKDRDDSIKKLADLGHDLSIIEAKERGFLSGFRLPADTAAPLFKHDPTMPSNAKYNMNKPLAYHSFYPDIYQREIARRKADIEALKNKAAANHQQLDSETQVAKKAEDGIKQLTQNLQQLATNKPIFDIAAKELKDISQKDLEVTEPLLARLLLPDTSTVAEMIKGAGVQKDALQAELNKAVQRLGELKSTFDAAKQKLEKKKQADAAVLPQKQPDAELQSAKKADEQIKQLATNLQQLAANKPLFDIAAKESKDISQKEVETAEPLLSKFSLPETSPIAELIKSAGVQKDTLQAELDNAIKQLGVLKSTFDTAKQKLEMKKRADAAAPKNESPAAPLPAVSPAAVSTPEEKKQVDAAAPKNDASAAVSIPDEKRRGDEVASKNDTPATVPNNDDAQAAVLSAAVPTPTAAPELTVHISIPSPSSALKNSGSTAATFEALAASSPTSNSPTMLAAAAAKSTSAPQKAEPVDSTSDTDAAPPVKQQRLGARQSKKSHNDSADHHSSLRSNSKRRS